MSRKAFLVFLVFACSVLAEDTPAGNWDWSMQGSNGETVTATMNLAVDGKKVTGSFAFGESRKLQVDDGSWDGKQLKFSVKRDRPSGGSMVYQMTATLSGTSLKGSVDAEIEGQKITQQWKAEKK